jgi:carboxylesterase type B
MLFFNGLCITSHTAFTFLTHLLSRSTAYNSTSVAALMVSPATKGLFAKAIMESNPIALPLMTPKIAQKVGGKFAKALKCKSGSGMMACLRQRSVGDIVKAQKTAEKTVILNDLWELFYAWTPSINATLVPGEPLTLIREGKAHPIPLMAGTVQEEGLLFVRSAFPDPSKLSKIAYEVSASSAFVVTAYFCTLFSVRANLTIYQYSLHILHYRWR